MTMDEQQVMSQEINQPASPNAPQSVDPASQSPVETPPQSRGKSNKLVLVVIILLLLAGATFGGYMIGKQSAPTPSPTPVATVTPTASPDPMAEWETYSNDQYLFKYPNSYAFQENPDKTITITHQSGIFLTIKELSTNDYLQYKPCSEMASLCLIEDNPFQIELIKDVVVGEKRSKSFYLTSGGLDNDYHVIQTTEGILLNISAWIGSIQYGDGEYENIFDQILSTFQFTE